MDDPRPGRPASVTAEQVEDVVVATLESTPENATHWSRTSMAERSGLSKSTIGRIWKAFELQPHRTDEFKLSNDPLFVEKVYDIVGLYLNPPEAAVVLCVDEKSQIQALARSQPAFPMMPGMPEKRTHDYVRTGTTSLFAAFDTADGTVISALHRRHRAIEFRKFLIKIDTQVPDHLDIHLVCDNYGTHKTPAVQNWLANHPRFHMHYTPTYSSWINQVERWFAELTRQLIGRGDHRSVQALEATSAPGSPPGTTTRNHSSGPRPPNRSSSPSDDLLNELTARDTRSTGCAAAACTLTRTWPGPGSSTVTSATRRTSGPPKPLMVRACIFAPRWCRGSCRIKRKDASLC